jgi:hypothetical protein
LRPRRFTRGDHDLVEDRPLMGVSAFHRTLEQELQALLRGVSLECLVCGEFVLHAGGMITCPECGSSVRAALGSAEARLQFDTQTG